jgi:gas vesicle protein
LCYGIYEKKGSIDVKRTEICVFMVGFSRGAITSVLLTPNSGRATRARLTRVMTDGGAQVKEFGETLRDAALSVLEHGKDVITQHSEGVVEAIKRGSEAYRRAES